MIRFVEGALPPAAEVMCHEPNVCACRISCLWESYGSYPELLQMWVQFEESGAAAAVIALYGGVMTIYALKGADQQELVDFIRMCYCTGAVCNLPLWEHGKRAIVMQRKGYEETVSPLPQEESFSPEEIYRLMEACADEHFPVPAYEDFLLELSHRLRHHTATYAAVQREGGLGAFGMTAAMSSSCAVLGAVCTHPRFRRQGLGLECVRQLIRRIGNRTILLAREPGRNQQFYEAAGFSDQDCIYIME